MDIIKRKDVRADLMLIVVTIFWGSSFSLVKDVLGEISSANVLFLRFSIAALFLLPFVIKKRKKLTRQIFKSGIVCGLILMIAFIAQIIGINYTTASRSGFITGTCVVMVPILCIFILRTIPAVNAILGAMIVFTGLYFFTMADTAQRMTFNNGDFITLLCALFYALHVIALNHYSDGENTLWLTFIQISLTGIGGGIWASYTGSITVDFSIISWGKLLYLSVFCTIVAYGIQTWAQAYTTPTRAVIIFSMEPVFAAIIASWWLSEKIGLWGVIGGSMIVSGVIIAQIRKSDFKAAKNRREELPLAS